MAAKKKAKKKSTRKKKDAVKIWEVQHLPADLLNEDPANTQRQDRKTFEELKKNIQQHGFDENLIVTVNEDGETYTIRSGNHRFRAGRALGMAEFPCVVRSDWDEVAAALQSVRRNYARGEIDRAAFTAVVDELQKTHKVDMDDIYGGMGFTDADAFSVYYEQEKATVDSIARDVAGSASAEKVKLMDNLGLVLSHIFEEYGDTVPCSFIVFPAGGKHHMFIQSTNALKKVLGSIATRCEETGLDMSTAIAGLLQIGLNNTDFLKDNKKSEMEDLEVEMTDDPEDDEIEVIK